VEKSIKLVIQYLSKELSLNTDHNDVSTVPLSTFHLFFFRTKKINQTNEDSEINNPVERSTAEFGVKHKSRILAVYYVFNVNISFTFQAIKNLSAHPTYLYRFGDFLIYFEINSFSERISKIYGNRKF